MVGDVTSLLRELLQAWEQAIAAEKQRPAARLKAVAVA
jgi:flagellin-specific chaperone FliS